MHLTHTLEIFIDNNSKYLILGSFPGVKSREYNFYYSHPTNRFFPILYKLFDEPYSTSIEDRKAFLKKHNIALYDVIYECDICGSSDSSIKNPTVIDIKDILTRYPNIKCIGVNGGKAKQLFDRYLLDDVKRFGVEIYYLPSTSPANARMGLDELVERYRKMFNK